MTVKPTILFEVEEYEGELTIYIPVGDGSDTLDRSSCGSLASKGELVKLEHFIHDSSAGPFAFTSLMPPEVVWDLAFRDRGYTYDFRENETINDLFIAEVCFNTDSRDYRPLIITASHVFMYQTMIIRQKHLNVCLRIEQYFWPKGRDSEPSFFVQVPYIRPEIIYGQFEEEQPLFFKCSVWDVLLRHHLSNWSEQVGGEITFERHGDLSTPTTTPVFFKKATSSV